MQKLVKDARSKKKKERKKKKKKKQKKAKINTAPSKETK